MYQGPLVIQDQIGRLLQTGYNWKTVDRRARIIKIWYLGHVYGVLRLTLPNTQQDYLGFI